MKQFWKILKFELKNYFTNKVFVGVTAFLVVAVAVVMFYPRAAALFETEDDTPQDALPVMLVVGDTPENAAGVTQAFAAAFPDYAVEQTDAALDAVKERIASGEAECAFVLHGLTEYTYYVGNLALYDGNRAVADEVLKSLYRMSAMVQSGLTPEQASAVMNTPIAGTTENLGQDQMHNFFYTYIMIFALYMVILLYGQMVATNVATEKSSRAMELLITSARPTAMMFGKVLSSCLAGLTQLVLVFGSAALFYQLNRDCWGDNAIVNSMFDIPLGLLGYMLTFFVLGFLIYAFLFGAIGSTASKLEDINTSTMPLLFLFIIAFMVVVFSMTSGNVENPVMVVCSFIPFTSPMAMFTRIAMSTVPWYEIVISIALLIGTTVGVGVLSAKIYRVGVLLYGTTPKISAIFKAIRKA